MLRRILCCPYGDRATTRSRPTWSARQQLLRQERSLQGAEFDQAFLREGDEAGELLARKGGFLARALHLDELAAAGHDDVEVDFRVLVLDVGEVEQFAAAEDA